ncbi:hypothetical protein JTB14_015654 [Gonioctena quinquepunctata]|nr:hypothetical protein JTB14_015654 [Gonioctena quinquepunctata]
MSEDSTTDNISTPSVGSDTVAAESYQQSPAGGLIEEKFECIRFGEVEEAIKTCAVAERETITRIDDSVKDTHNEMTKESFKNSPDSGQNQTDIQHDTKEWVENTEVEAKVDTKEIKQFKKVRKRKTLGIRLKCKPKDVSKPLKSGDYIAGTSDKTLAGKKSYQNPVEAPLDREFSDRQKPEKGETPDHEHIPESYQNSEIASDVEVQTELLTKSSEGEGESPVSSKMKEPEEELSQRVLNWKLRTRWKITMMAMFN